MPEWKPHRDQTSPPASVSRQGMRQRPQRLPQSGLLTNGGCVRFGCGIRLEVRNFPQELCCTERSSEHSAKPSRWWLRVVAGPTGYHVRDLCLFDVPRHLRSCSSIREPSLQIRQDNAEEKKSETSSPSVAPDLFALRSSRYLSPRLYATLFGAHSQ